MAERLAAKAAAMTEQARSSATARARDAAGAARDAVSARAQGGLLGLLRMDDDRRVTIEGVPEPMTKRAAVRLLWRLRDVAGDAQELEGTGVRERLFPGRRVKAFVAEAVEQLGRPVPAFPVAAPPTAE